MKHIVRSIVGVVVGLAALLAATAPAVAITGGQEDTPTRTRTSGSCSSINRTVASDAPGTLVEPRVVLTAGHCTFLDIGKVAVTFDPVISRTEEEAERDLPRAADDSGPDDAVSDIGFTEADVTPPSYAGEQQWFLGTAVTHPQYSDFTDLKNWNDTGVIILDEAPGLPTSSVAPANYLDQFAQPRLNSTEFLTIGYGTEVRQAESGPQTPTPQRQPIVRRYTTEIGQKLTSQILQTNGNEHDPRAGGGTCFGDSGGPVIHDGFVVGDTSYGYTKNCRYLDGTSASTSRSCVTGCSTASPTSVAPRRSDAGGRLRHLGITSRLVERARHGEHDVVVPALADDLDRDGQHAVGAVRHHHAGEPVRLHGNCHTKSVSTDSRHIGATSVVAGMSNASVSAIATSIFRSNRSQSHSSASNSGPVSDGCFQRCQ